MRAAARRAAGFGFAAAVWAFLVPWLGGRASPLPYSHAAQYISELGARDAANGGIVSWAGFALTGLFALGFVVLARAALPRSRLASAGLACLAGVGVAYLASAVFPCDPGCPAEGSVSQSIHSSAGLVEYLGGIAGFLLLALALHRAPGWRALALAAVIAALGVALGFAGMLSPALASMRGLSQRLAELAIFGWIAVASVGLLRVRARER